MNAGFNFRQTLHQVISLSGCTSPSAGVAFGLNENMHVAGCFQTTGLVEVTQRWSVQRGHCSCLAWPGPWPEPGCLLQWPRSAGEAAYQLYVMPSALRICQGERDVSLVRVCKENQSLMTHETADLVCRRACVCIFLDRCISVCITYFFYPQPLRVILTHSSHYVHIAACGFA